MQARLRCRRAQVMHRFNWHPDQIAVLTDRQIEELCYHHVDEKGNVCLPPEEELVGLEVPDLPTPKTIKDHLRDLELLKNYLGTGLDPEEARRAEEALKAKYGQPEQAS